jgi:hypothetical protein
MDRKRAKQYQTIAFVLLVIAFVCILLNIFFFKMGETQHIILSILILILSVSAYFIRRFSKSEDM